MSTGPWRSASHNKLLLKCDYCGLAFTAFPSDRISPTRFCSIACANRAKRKPEDPAVRFWRKVSKTDSCWIWMAGVTSSGYGQFMVGKSPSIKAYAHRFSWTLAHGPIPDGLFVCHRCDTPRCVRPDHLFLGTARENMHDALRKHRPVGRPSTRPVIAGSLP